MQYIVIEIQTYVDGTIGTLITSHKTRNEAENKYHTVLAAAAISNLPQHSATMLLNSGEMVMFQGYAHGEGHDEQ